MFVFTDVNDDDETLFLRSSVWRDTEHWHEWMVLYKDIYIIMHSITLHYVEGDSVIFS